MAKKVKLEEIKPIHMDVQQQPLHQIDLSSDPKAMKPPILTKVAGKASRLKKLIVDRLSSLTKRRAK